MGGHSFLLKTILVEQDALMDLAMYCLSGILLQILNLSVATFSMLSSELYGLMDAGSNFPRHVSSLLDHVHHTWDDGTCMRASLMRRWASHLIPVYLSLSSCKWYL